MARRRRLNTNLIIALFVGLAVAGLGAYFAARYVRDNPERAAERAEAYEQQGDWQRAAGQWNKAYRGTSDPQYQLRGVEAVMHLTSDPDEGDEQLARAAGGLNELVSRDPSNAPVARRLMRFHAESPTFLRPIPSAETREVREKAALVLAQIPDDNEAAIFHAAATLNLAATAGEQIPTEEVEAARATLLERLPATPINGTGLEAYSRDLLTRLSAESDPEAAEALLEEAQATLEAVATAARNHTPREEYPTDTAELLMNVAQARLGISEIAARQRAQELLRADRDAGRPQDTAAANAAAQEMMEPARAQTLADLEDAKAALDVQRDADTRPFREVYNALATAKQLFGDREGAEQDLRDLLAARPYDLDAALLLGRLLSESNRATEALEVVRGTVELDEEAVPTLYGFEGSTFRRNRLMANLYLSDFLLDARRATDNSAERRSLLEEARQSFERYRTTATTAGLRDNYQSERVEGQLLIAQGRSDQGQAKLSSALERTRQFAGPGARREQLRLLRLLAEANRDLNQTGAEMGYLSEAVDLGGNLTEVERLVTLYRRTDRNDQAIALLDRLLEPARDVGDDVRQWAVTTKAQLAPEDDRAAAVAALPETTDLDRRRKLQAAIGVGDDDLALRLVRRLRDDSPDDPLMLLQEAGVLARMNRQEEAAALLRSSDDPRAVAMLDRFDRGVDAVIESIQDPMRRALASAQVAQQRRDVQEADRLLDEAIKLQADGQATPDAGELLFELLVAADRLDDAEQVAERLRESPGDGLGGRTYAVRLQLARGDTEEALDPARRLAQQHPRSAAAQSLFARTLRLNEQPAAAVAPALAAVELRPDDVRTLSVAVDALAAAGRAREAGELIERGLRLQPNNALLRQASEQYALRFSDPSQILQARRDAVAATPDVPAAHGGLIESLVVAAEAATQRGEDATALRREAADAAREAVTRFPDDGRLYALLARSSLAAGDEAVAAARPIMERVTTPSDEASMIDDPRVVAAATDFYSSLGEFPQAEAVVRRYLATPTVQDRQMQAAGLAMLSRLLAQQGRAQEAVEVLRGYEDLPGVVDRQIVLLAGRAAGATESAEGEALLEDVRALIADTDDIGAAARRAAAVAELRVGEADRAVALLDDQEDAQSLVLLGQAMANRDEPDLERAAELMDRAAAADAGGEIGRGALRDLSQIEQARGNRDSAATALRRLLERFPDDVRARLSLARMDLAKSPPDYAAADRILRGGPATGENPLLLMTRARMEMDRDRRNEAVDLGRLAVEQSFAFATGAVPPTGDPRVDTAAARVPALVNTYLDLLLRAGRTEEALRQIDGFARRLENGSSAGQLPWWLQRRRAEALARAGQRRDAEASFKASFDAAMASAGPRVAGNVAVEAAKRLDAAFGYSLVRDGVEADPIDPQAAAIAATIFGQSGDTSRAIELTEQVRASLQAAGRLSRSQAARLDLQAGTLHLQADPPNLEEAVAAFRSMLDTQPDSVAGANNIAYALTLRGLAERDLGEDAAARKSFEEAEAFGKIAADAVRDVADRTGGDPNVNVIDTHAWARVNLALATDDQDLLEAAIRDLRAARASSERDGEPLPELYYHLAVALEAAGETRAARESVATGLQVLDVRADDAEQRAPTDPATRRRLTEVLSRIELAAPVESEPDAAPAS